MNSKLFWTVLAATFCAGAVLIFLTRRMMAAEHAEALKQLAEPIDRRQIGFAAEMSRC